MASFAREVAYRIFAQELRDTAVALERDLEDVYAPQYVLSPTGAKINRVFVVGTLTEKEDIGHRHRCRVLEGTHIGPDWHVLRVCRAVPA